MKRFIRRAVVVSGLVTAGFALQAPSASAGDLCVGATVFVNGTPIGDSVCQPVGPLLTTCVTVWDTTVSGTGAGGYVCVPV